MERGTTAPAVHTHRQYPINVTEAQSQQLLPCRPNANGEKKDPTDHFLKDNAMQQRYDERDLYS